MAYKSIFNLLPKEMTEYTSWSANKVPPFSAIETTVSGKVWSGIPGGHKWLGYFPFYDREFGKYHGKNPKVLEIGVYRGASLYLWRTFFGEGATIVGIDIDEKCRAFANPDLNISVEIGDQSDPGFLNAVIEKHGPFDIILDDGSHVASHQIASFNGLFMRGLKDTGLYYVEDLECMYWSHTNEFRDTSVSSVEFFKTLIDVQNNIFEDYRYDDFFLNNPQSRSQFNVIELAKHIGSIKFARGVVLIDKAPQDAPSAMHL
jgi:23S rRNA U2552 (ribose-2'-O)-methylase RlmE/FtsJ